MRKNMALLLSIMLGTALFTGCKGEPMSSVTSLEDESAVQNLEKPAAQTPGDVTVLNFTPPQAGEKIAVITVKDYGDIKIKLFPEESPLGVENFIGLAEMGYYDELIFHRIIPGFMNQGGDPRGNGTGGNSIWGDRFDGGVSDKLFHFSGALAYANSGSTDTNGSQFYIVNTAPGEIHMGGAESFEQLAEYGYVFPENIKEKYRELGGTIMLDGNYTVFGQVFEGMETVRAMSQVETDENDKPLKQVMIEKVEIIEYQG